VQDAGTDRMKGSTSPITQAVRSALLLAVPSAHAL